MIKRASLMTAAVMLAALMAATAPARADDASDIKAVISGQLQAFKSGDKTTAYSYAAPSIKGMFPSADIFMTMVEQGYPPVFHSSNTVFGTPSAEGKGFRQDVYITDTDGKSWIASYTLERSEDGAFKITGCSIRKGNDLAA